MDADALTNIYNNHYSNVYNYIAYRINNHHDAEELASLVFERAISAWARYDPAKSPEAWLIGIAKNAVTDYLRARGRRRVVGLDAIVNFRTFENLPDEVAVLNEEHRELVLAMAKLKYKERQILSLKFATELKSYEIAEILKMSESAVRVAASRAVKKLRTILEVDYEV